MRTFSPLHNLVEAIRALTRAIENSKSPSNGATIQDLHELELKIMKTQAEIAADLRNAVTTINKIGDETDKLKQTVADLQAAVANQPNATQELQDAAQAVSDQLKVVDDKVPDAVPVPPAPAP